MDDYNALLSSATDISDAFEHMDEISFHSFLKTKSEEVVLAIRYQLTGSYTDDKNALARLQSFLDQTPPLGQKRFAVVKATEQLYQLHLDSFTGGLRWEKIEG
jgi:hypothetical protein